MLNKWNKTLDTDIRLTPNFSIWSKFTVKHELVSINTDYGHSWSSNSQDDGIQTPCHQKKHNPSYLNQEKIFHFIQIYVPLAHKAGLYRSQMRDLPYLEKFHGIVLLVSLGNISF